jgi:uncharacterized membrane protein (UPF0127 family)
MNKMNIWITYTLLAVVLIMMAGFVYFYFANNQRIEEEAIQAKEKNTAIINSFVTSTSTINSSSTSTSATNSEQVTSTEDWQTIYPKTKPLQIAGVDVLSSVARTWPDRIKGLSGTPYLPENVVKLFVFDSIGYPSIWMKDMNYSIDIIWVNDKNKIVHIVEEASPDSYPTSFTPDAPALYVIETASGFVAKNKIKVGDDVVQPE